MASHFSFASTPSGELGVMQSFVCRAGRLAAGVALFLVILLASPWGVTPVAAQTTVEPSRVDPGVIKKRFERQPTPKAQLPLEVPETDLSTPPPGGETVRFVLNEIRVEGNTAFSGDELKLLWQESLAKEVTLTKLFEIAADITIHYRNSGYILSRAIVVPQEINNGVVEIEIIEGFIDTVIIDGKPSEVKFQIKHKMEAIKRSRPLQASDLERYMLLINDLPGVSAQSVLRPSPTISGASELVIIIAETPVSASVSIDNRGTRFVGPHQGIATINFSNIMGLYESTEFQFIMAGEFDSNVHSGDRNDLLLGKLEHSQLLTGEGTRLDVSATRNRVHVGATLEDSEIVATGWSGSISLVHPIIRSRGKNLYTALRFDYSNSRTKVLGELDSEDGTRAISINESFDFVDRFRGINLIGFEVQQGLDVLGARESGSVNLTRTNGRSDYTIVNTILIRDQDLGRGLSVYISASGQYAFSQLLASQECGIGGQPFGRGYDPSEISGEHCASGSVELRSGHGIGATYLESFELFAFYDMGAIWRIDKDRNIGGKRDTAASAGFGVRVNFLPTLFASIEIAKPLTKAPTASRDDFKKSPRVFFRVTTRF